VGRHPLTADEPVAAGGACGCFASPKNILSRRADAVLNRDAGHRYFPAFRARIRLTVRDADGMFSWQRAWRARDLRARRFAASGSVVA
jgi:hypothetical protein